MELLGFAPNELELGGGVDFGEAKPPGLVAGVLGNSLARAVAPTAPAPTATPLRSFADLTAGVAENPCEDVFGCSGGN